MTDAPTPPSEAARRFASEVNEHLGWDRQRLMSDAAAQEWLSAGYPSREVARWVIVGISRTDRVPAGLSPMDYRALSESTTPLVPGWAGVGQACSGSVRILRPSGKDPAHIVGLVLALMSANRRDTGAHGWMGRCPRYPNECTVIHQCRRVMREGAGLDWAALAVCIRAGLGLDEAEAHVRAGRDMEPVRVMAALS